MNFHPFSLKSVGTFFFAFILILHFHRASATHTAGGGMTYVSISNNEYAVTVTTYQDCLTGDPDAIRDDNPSLLHIYTGNGQYYGMDSIWSSQISPVTPTYTGCGTAPSFCLKKAVFTKTLHLPVSVTGYIVIWQRCCRDAGIVNIVNPLSVGATYYCVIPPQPSMANSSAVFTHDTHAIVCSNNFFTIDNSATDADGDSLSYEFCQPYRGGTANDAKPRSVPPPPYAPVNFNNGYSYTLPVNGNPAISINPTTGIVSGKPNLSGKYLISLACHEWRAGNLVNTVRLEYEILVTNCPGNLQPYTLDTTILAGQTINFSAPAGGISYAWHPGIYLSDSTIPNPTGFYPDAGSFYYNLETDGVAGCSRNDTIKVHVTEIPVLFMPTAFSPNGDGVNDIFKPKSVGPYVIRYLKVFDRNGQLVSDDIAGWDGSYNGTKLAMGSYLWTMQYVDKDGAIKSTKGTVSLLR